MILETLKDRLIIIYGSCALQVRLLLLFRYKFLRFLIKFLLADLRTKIVRRSFIDACCSCLLFVHQHITHRVLYHTDHLP